MTEQDARFWQQQIRKAKRDNKTYFEQAKQCQEAYCATGSYNIFYSNVRTLKAYLLSNAPKPNVERRFIKKATKDILAYNTFMEVSRIVEAALIYYTDIASFLEKIKHAVEQAVKTGRGVLWVEYRPKIAAAQDGREFISERTIKIESLGYEDYLCSTSKDELSVWWKARRHLLGKKDLKEQFNYEAKDEDFSFTDGNNEKQDSRKLAEIWEIWDKSSKRRLYILADGGENRFLKETSDPYGIDCFFPCADWTPLTSGRDIIPIPEYEIYKNKAIALDTLSDLGDKLEKRIRYVVTTDMANQDNVSNLAGAQEGDIVTLATANPLAGANNAAYLGFLPINEAVALAEHREHKKALLKQDIYDITGISDIMRGQTESAETATAQKIKGVFGSLRFQDQQKQVQNWVVKIFKIIAEIVCEHWDAQSLQSITSAVLPTKEEKMEILSIWERNKAIEADLAKGDVLDKDNIQKMRKITKEDINKLRQPSWEDILAIMRDNKLRDYTIEVESTATVFDDIQEQNAAINSLFNAYQNIVALAAQYNSPAVLRGFLPIAKMQLMNIKAGKALCKQLLDALENAAEDLEKNLESSRGQVPPEIELKNKELALKVQTAQADLRNAQMRAQTELLKEQNRAKELALKEQQVLNEERKAQAEITDKARQTDIKRQDSDRKNKELNAQIAFKTEELRRTIDFNGNVPGEVGPIDTKKF